MSSLAAKNLALATLLCLAGCAHVSPAAAPAAPPDPRFAACERVLRDQVAAWNRGDLDGFARGYHKSPHTVFSSTSGTTVGHQKMLDRYRKGYPDRQAMGRLTFTGLTYEGLKDDEVLVRGTWRLVSSKKGKPYGRFVLVMRRIDGAWRVVLDYTNLLGK